MKISSSSINYSSSRINISKKTTYERFHAWNKNSGIISESSSENGEVTGKAFSEKSLVSKNPGKPVSDYLQTRELKQSEKMEELSEKLKEYAANIRVRMIKDILEAFTGERIEMFDPSSLKSDESSENSDEGQKDQSSVSESPEVNETPDWGIDYYFKETSYSAEGISFEADGVINTADGETITFSASLEMLRESYTEESLSIKAGAALIDPIMVDLSGKGIRFSDALFEFDLDGNGKKELINAPAAETGFLAIDKNGNGIIDNGMELFGPQTADGFSELAQLDDDGNEWIDENDEAFDKLMIWQKTADGSDKISSLRKSGIGALSLKGIDTRFNLSAGSDLSSDEIAAVLKKTSLLIKENKDISFLQEVDFVV